jgi:uncharacterized protein YceH (UPF0502 family)
MSLILSPEEIRVLGVLMEKDMATPEYYPLSLNALVTGCNQKSNRDPIVNFDEATVSAALDSLRAKQLIMLHTGSRVTKYAHRASELMNVNNRELAVLCVLMLRGAQTLNEIKTRTQSLYEFDDLESVEGVLRKLEERGMVAFIERQPGMREPRWTHVFLGRPLLPAMSAVDSAPAPASGQPSLAERVTRLEAEVAGLRAELAEFRRQFQ